MKRGEELPSLFRDLPTLRIANHKLGREDIQVRRMFGQSLHAISPVFTAVHQYFDRMPNFGNGGPPGGLAGQHFQDGQLEGQLPRLRSGWMQSLDQRG
ncbi:hypothetical protein A6X20_24230 [Bradyrhizobium elkanii]|nr:hypothetical protein A6X20_24230 [Bradyrhizobium elkanii]ODM81420.1 hypothetical protein A6452_22000 [Bradyrhizobium elkanii]